MSETDLSIQPTRDVAHIRSDWTPSMERRIDGVATYAITSVITDDGHLTEMWRADWHLDDGGVEQVFQRTLSPGAISGWHVHLSTTDRLFCGSGDALIVLFDARNHSPTHGVVSEHRFGEHRPMVLSVPPGVVHGVKALGARPVLIINAVDHAYCYDEPDHYRLSLDTPDIPYRF
jgi:dTDP-4-dehydrorhamnose 3,5-epimerase